MNKHLRLLLFLLITGTTLSCYDCGPMGEPLVDISLSPRNQLVRVSALGARSDSIFNRDTPSPFSYYNKIPISLLQDSTTFLFYSKDKVDTLTLYYKRVFDTSKRCGYYNDIKAPERGPYYRSTFPMVEVEYYSYLGAQEPKHYGPRGISIRIQNNR